MIPTRPAFKPYTIVEEIDGACDSPIASINVRRQQLHELLKERQKQLKDLYDCRERAQLEFPHVNLLLQASASNWYRCPEFISNLYSHTYRKEREAYGHLKVAVKCNREAFRESISNIIDVVLDVTNPEDMSYKEETYQPRVMSAGREGKGAGEYNRPSGVAIDESTQELFVGDMNLVNQIVVVCSSNTGEYQQEFGENGCPSGIAITPDSIFVTDPMRHRIQKYSRPYYQFVMQVGTENSPRGITVNNPKTSLLYVCDFNDNTFDDNMITVYDTRRLNYLYYIGDRRLMSPVDVKLAGDHMYVLCLTEVVLFIREKYVRRIIDTDSALLTSVGFFSMDKFNNS